MHATPTIFSFFSGIGLLDLAFEDAGFPITMMNEFHKPFYDTYLHARRQMEYDLPRVCVHGSATSFLDGQLKKDLKFFLKQARKDHPIMFVAGPPCPDFSVAGKNRGREGDKGMLTQAYFQLIKTHKPDIFLFENVKGLWKTKKHREFYDEMKLEIQQAGYVLTDKLINSLQYGVPQDRERVILIGMRKPFAKKVLWSSKKDILQAAFDWNKHATFPDKEAFSYPWPTTDKFAPTIYRNFPSAIPLELTVQHWFTKNNVATHANAYDFFQPRAALPRFRTIREGDVSKKSFKRLHRWRYSPTACYGNNEVHLHPYEARRISAAEALAIQSAPSEFELPPTMTLTDMFKSIGNGVPYLAANAIAQTLKELL